MTVEINTEQERIIQEQLASRRYKSVDEVIAAALASLPENRREAVRRMIDFAERRMLDLGEPVTRKFLHEGHRF